jgi:hypothetical protein
MESTLKRVETTILAAVLLGIAAGCSPLGLPDSGYSAPQHVVYGTRQRVGIAAVSYAQTERNPGALGDAFGFDVSPKAEVFYALPLGPGSDLKIAVGSRSWWRIYDAGLYVALVEMKQTGVILLLRGGWTWGRFGAHIGAGPGWVFYDLEGLPDSTASRGDFALEVECGVSMALRNNLNIGFDLGYRANSTDYTWNGYPEIWNLNSITTKVGINFMF